jgi:hypothetical protein
MSFNPLEHRGIPLDEQIRDWRELNVDPIDPELVDPYTRHRIITMNSVEMEAVLFSHAFSRRCPDLEVRRQLAEIRYMEHQQQKVVNWLLPGQASTLETTIAYEQVAVDLTARVAKTEPDPCLAQAYQFGVLEDCDHLYRYANLYEIVERRRAEKITEDLTELMPGRPSRLHHRLPVDNVREPYDWNATAPISKLHAMTIMAVKQQVMNYYLNVGPGQVEPIARQLYQEIGLIEEEHVTHYGSLVDPGETWWEQLVNHEYSECYLYYSFMQTETDPRIKAIWELHLNMELTHLHRACDLLRSRDGRVPEQVLAPELPNILLFEPSKEYLRDLLAAQINLTTLGIGYVRDTHERFAWMQQRLNGRQPPPSDLVINDQRTLCGTDRSPGHCDKRSTADKSRTP